MYTNETAMHQPISVHYIATVYTMYLFQHTFVSLPRINMPTVFSEVAITVRTYFFPLSRLVLELIIRIPTLSGVLLYKKPLVDQHI